jgi:hypothetical protein
MPLIETICMPSFRSIGRWMGEIFTFKDGLFFPDILANFIPSLGADISGSSDWIYVYGGLFGCP